MVWLAALGGCWSEPRPLTPADVGLPDQPDALVPVAALPARGGPVADAFWHRDTCPRDARGCVLSKTVTAEEVTTLYDCGGTGLRGGKQLRRLALAATDLDGPLDVWRVRAAAAADVVRACFGDHAGTARAVGVIGAGGQFQALDVTGDGAACVRERLARAEFPAAAGPTRVELAYVYEVDDPRAYVGLSCR